MSWSTYLVPTNSLGNQGALYFYIQLGEFQKHHDSSVLRSDPSTRPPQQRMTDSLEAALAPSPYVVCRAGSPRVRGGKTCTDATDLRLWLVGPVFFFH